MTRAERLQVMERFLEAYALSGVRIVACQAAGIHRSLVGYWQERDLHGFAERLRQADAEADDRIRAEIRRRAIMGTEKPVYQGKELVGHIREYSDTLLIFLAKSRMPEFRERVQVDLTLVRQEVERLAREAGLTDEETVRAVVEAEGEVGAGRRS